MKFSSFIKEYAFVLFYILFTVISFSVGFLPGERIYSNFQIFILEMISFIPLMFILIGLFDVWFPKQVVERHIGEGSGLKGIIWVVLLAMLQAGPLYGAFPVAYMLYKKGCSIRNVFIYLGAFSTMKIPMLSFEIGFLGLKFSLLRTSFSLPVFIIIGILMETYLKNRNFEIKKP